MPFRVARSRCWPFWGTVIALLVQCCQNAAASAAEAPAAGSQPSPAANRIERLGGVPTFIIEGKPHTGVCYSTYDCSEANLSRRVGHFGAAGCHLYNFVVEIAGYGFSRPMWVGPERWDFTELDRRAATVLAADPQARFLPRIYIDAPEWWLRQHPEARMLLDGGAAKFDEKHYALPRAGEFASLASPEWRRAMCRGLEAVIDHIERSPYGPRVVGYQLSGQKTEEWYHWSMNAPRLADYSPPMQAEFRRWLAARYGSDAALATAWRRPGVTLRTAEIPTQAQRFGDRSRTFRDPAAERPVIDFHRFWSDVMADTIAVFAAAVKTKTRGTRLVGAFYGYTLEFTELAEDAGHLALGRLLESPAIDFVMAPSSYFDRKLPGKPYFRHPAASFALAGKIAWDDFDQVSFKWYDKLKTEPALAQWEWQMGLTKTAEQFGWMNRREVGLALAQGVQLAHFDIHGGYYEDPVIMEDVRRLIDLRGRALAAADRTSTAQILAVVDEDSEHFLSFRHPILTPLLSGQTAELGFVGPYDVALMSDLDRLDLRRYKLVVMLNTVRLDDAQRRIVREKLARDGRTVLWLYAPGYVTDGGLSADAMRELCGIRVMPDPKMTRGGIARTVEAASRAPTKFPLTGGDPFCVEDSTAEPLALRDDPSGKVVAARKRLPGWTSVYSFPAPVPAIVLRRWAAEAGVHLYTDRTDWLVAADHHRLMLAASQTGGDCRVTLPAARTVRDALTGQPISDRTTQFTLRLRPSEVRILELH